MEKYSGIDSREIKCCSKKENSIGAGISFDENDGVPLLFFHYLDHITLNEKQYLTQITKFMHLDKENTDQLIAALLEIKSKL